MSRKEGIRGFRMAGDACEFEDSIKAQYIALIPIRNVISARAWE
jgi:hypothetical protein